MNRQRELTQRQPANLLTRLASLLAADPQKGASNGNSRVALSAAEREELQSQIEARLVQHLTALQSQGRTVGPNQSPADEAVDREHVFSELSRERVYAPAFDRRTAALRALEFTPLLAWRFFASSLLRFFAGRLQESGHEALLPRLRRLLLDASSEQQPLQRPQAILQLLLLLADLNAAYLERAAEDGLRRDGAAAETPSSARSSNSCWPEAAGAAAALDGREARESLSPGGSSSAAQTEDAPCTAEPTPRTSGLALSLSQQNGPPAARAALSFSFERPSLLSLPRVYGERGRFSRSALCRIHC